LNTGHKTHTQQQMPFYAVAKGNPPGIYSTWSECKDAISGYAGAKYKKFELETDAIDFINGTVTPEVFVNDQHTSYVYTDGSCSNNGGPSAQAGIGIYFSPDDPRNVSERVIGKQTNNTAEIGAIIRAFNVLEKEIKSKKHITICSDSQYAIRAATTYGEKCSKTNWSADIPNKELVKTVYNLYKDWPNVVFKYVPAHTGKQDIHSLGNDGADKLANAAVGLEQRPNTKVYLNVAYAEKEEAKALGAKWDPTKKKWYAPEFCKNTDELVAKFN